VSVIVIATLLYSAWLTALLAGGGVAWGEVSVIERLEFIMVDLQLHCHYKLCDGLCLVKDVALR